MGLTSLILIQKLSGYDTGLKGKSKNSKVKRKKSKAAKF